MKTADASRENRYLGEVVPRLLRFAGIPGLFLLGLGAVMTWVSDVSWERFLRSYVTAFCFVVSLSLGGLFFVMLQHLTRAGWSVVVRRIAEGLAYSLTWMWVLFIPIVIGLFTTDLYLWSDPAHRDAVLVHKAPYLNTTFWLIRAAAYFIIWAVLARYFVRNSLVQDATGDPKLTLRMQAVAAPGMIIYALTQTFAIIDWVMALEPHWFSTMFGVYFFAATTCGFSSALILICYFLQRSGRVQQSITVEHYHDLGKYLFAFGIFFWAYIAYSQYMLIWYANIQEETVWFLIRQLGGWRNLSLLLLIGHLAVPFLVLISRYPKRWKGFLALAATWTLFIHYIDVYWLAMPAVPPGLVESVATYSELATEFETTYRAAYDLQWHVLDATCLFGIGGIFVAMTAFGMRNHPLVPERDPRLGESLAFENY